MSQNENTQEISLLRDSDSIATIGGRLRSFIAWRGLSQREFAELTGIPYRTIQSYVTNAASPGAEHLAKISDAGLDMAWLVTGVFDDSRQRAVDAADFTRPAAVLFLADKRMFEKVEGKAVELIHDYFTRHPIAPGADPLRVRVVLRGYMAMMIMAGARAAENVTLKTKLSSAARVMIEQTALTAADEIPDEMIHGYLTRPA